mgnify:CR=1 FL=1
MLRKPDSIPAGDTLIEDPVMEPFFITRSQTGGYTVYERVVKGENNTEYIKFMDEDLGFKREEIIKLSDGTRYKIDDTYNLKFKFEFLIHLTHDKEKICKFQQTIQKRRK